MMKSDTSDHTKRPRRGKNDWTFEVEDGGEMSADDLDELMNTLATVVLRRYRKANPTDFTQGQPSCHQLDLEFEDFQG